MYDLARDQAEMELKAKIDEAHEFNEPRFAARQGRKTYHSGPKGVLTDYEEAKLKMRALRIQDQLKREQKSKYMTLDSASTETQHKLTIIDKQKQKVLREKERTDHKSQELDDHDNDDELLEDEEDVDDHILMQYKLEKMRIMEENRPRFGDTKEMTAWTFDKEVEQAPKNVWVVVHVYQDYMERCARMNYAIAQVAKSYPHIKFLRARSDRLGLDKYPEMGLPTLIVFKNGAQLQNHIAVHEVIGNPFEVKDVEAFLIKHKVIQPVVEIPDIEEFQQKKRNQGASSSKKKSGKILGANVLGSNKAAQHDSDDSELDID